MGYPGSSRSARIVPLWTVLLVAGLGFSAVAEAANSATVTIQNGPAASAVIPLGAQAGYALAPAGGVAPYTLTVLTPLPAGAGVTLLTGNARTVQPGLTGDTLDINPSVPGPYSFTIQATDANGITGTQTYTIVVPDFTAPLTTVLPNASVGVQYSEPLYVFSAATVGWSLASGSTMPPGLSITAAGVLKGTPTTANTYTFSLTFGDGTGSASQTFTLVVSNLAITAPATLPPAVAGVPYSYSVTATGGSGLTWSAPTCPSATSPCSGALPYGLTMSANGTISGTPPYSSAGFSPVITVTDGVSPLSRQFALFVSLPNPATLSYPLTKTTLPDAILNQAWEAPLNPTGGVAPYSWSVAPGSSLPPGLSLLSGALLPSDQPPGATVIAGQPSAVCPCTPFQLVATDSAGSQVTRTFSLNVTPLNLAPGALRSAILNSTYAQQLTVTGGAAPFTFSAKPTGQLNDMFPQGLSLGSTGLISGTDLGTGSFAFNLRVTDSASNILTRTITLNSTDASGLMITSGNQVITLGSSVNIPLTASGESASFTWTLASGSLPPGLSITGSTLWGTPATAGDYTFTLRATNSGNASGYALRQVTYHVSQMQLVVPAQQRTIPGDLPAGSVGSAYSFQLAMAGGVPPYTFTESAFAPLPPGISLGASGRTAGLISGTPQVSGVFPVSLLVTDSAGNTFFSPAELSLTIARAGAAAPLNTKSQWSINDASVGAAYLALLDPILAGGTPPYTWTLAGGSNLPPGLVLAAGSNGISSSLTGVATTPGTYSFSLVATDGGGQTLTVPFSLNVSSLLITMSALSGSGDPTLIGAQSADTGLRRKPAFAIPSGSVGAPYAIGISVSGGNPPYTGEQQNNFVPGMGLDPNSFGTSASVTGTPTASGIFPLNLHIVDASGNSVTVSYEFFIDNANKEVPSVTQTPEPVNVRFTIGSVPPGAIPIQVSSSSGSFPFSAAVEGLSFATLSATSGTTPASTNLTLNLSALGAGTYAGVVGVDAPGAVNRQSETPVIVTVMDPHVPQTITFGPLSNVPLGGTAPALTATASSGLAVSYAASPSSVCTVSAGVITLAGVGTCSITASQAGNASYAAAPNVMQSFNVMQASQTITFGPLSNTAFAGTAPALSASASSGLPVSYSASPSSVCTVSGVTITLVGVGTCSITASQSGNANYAPATNVVQSFNITQAAQTITFGPLSNAPFGGTAPVLSATASSGLAVSYSASPLTVCTVSGATISMLAGGTCSITASQAGNANYAAATSVTQSFTITPEAQTITFTPPPATTLGVAIPPLSATASSGLPVSFSSNSTSVCAVAGTIVGTLAPGTCSITASQPGNANFAAATPVTRTFTVNPLLTILASTLPSGTQSAPYSQHLSVSGGSGGDQWAIASGGLPAGLSLGGGLISGTPTVTGTFSFTVTVTDAAGAQSSQPFSIQINAALSITTGTLPDASRNIAYNQTLAAQGGSGGYSWSLTSGSLPDGITLSASGILSGTPSNSGTFGFGVMVNDSLGNQATRSFSLKVNSGVTITTTSLPPATQGSPYNQALGATGNTGVVAWTVISGSLPSGMTLSSNGVLSGTPLTPGSVSFTVQAKDSAGAGSSATQPLGLQVNAALIVTTSSLPAAVQGASYSQSLAATGGSGTLTWSVSAGALPGGLSLSSSGGLSGTPASAGFFAFTALVTDQAGNHAQGALSVQVNPPLTITTSSLPNAINGAAYNQSLAAAGGSGAYTWSVTAGALPGGISLSSGGGIAGTPSAAGSFSFTVQVADQAGNIKTQGLALQVNAVISITSSATLPNGITGKAYSASLAATGGTGGPYTWSVSSGTLPPGITLSSAGALGGNPSLAGPFSFTVQASDGVSTPAQLALSATVYNALSITTAFLPNGTATQAYGPVSLAATGGSGTVTWSVSGLPSALSASADGSISGTPAAAGNSTLTITATDATSAQTTQATLGLTIVAPASPLNVSPSSLVLGAGAGGNISGGFTATGGTPPLTWSVSSGALPAGVSLNSSNGAVGGSVSQPGNTTATVSVTDGKTTANAQLTINVLGLTTASIPAGAATVAYSTGFAATGGTPPYVFSATGLPAGVSMGGGGNLSGTVASPGTYPFTVQVSDSQGLSVASGYSLTIRNAPVTIKAPSLPNGTVGAPYSQVLAATGGTPPYTWSTVSGALPAGLSLASSGTISGNPSAPGTSSFAVQATDASGGVASAQVSIAVLPSTLKLTTGSLPSGVVGFDYPAQVMGASGGTSPYVYSITGGGLPAGLSLSGGVISGNPTSAGTFPITLGVTDSNNLTASANVVLTIRQSTSDLLLSSGNASFSLASGTTAIPAPQSVSVQSTVAAQPVTYTLDVEPPSPWLNVGTGSKTPNTVGIGLTAQALTLAAGSYSATVTLTCTSASCNGKTQSVAVALSVTAPPPQLGVTGTLLSFSSSSTPPQPQSQPMGIQNTGGGTITVNSITCEASWCSVGNVPALLPAGFSTQVTVTVDPTHLGTGFFRTAVDVVTSVGNVTIPVDFFVTQTVSMTLSPSGSQFEMQQGGAPGNPSGSFLVSVSGGSASWTAAVLSGSNWLTLNTAAGTSTASQPGTVSFAINAGAAGLAPQAYYGTIEVTAPGLLNSPQDYQVVLSVVPPSGAVQPDPEPGGLLFVSNASAAAPPAQLVTVYSSSAIPVSYQTSANSTGGAWLSVTPALGTTSSASPGQSTVTVNTAGLAPGTYTGGISYSSTGAAVRTVNVTLVIAPAGGAIASPSARTTFSGNSMTPQGACSPSSLVAAPTALVANFSAPTSWPTPLAISLVDNCGNFVTDGQVTATFSNGDPPLALPLVNAAKGLYSATWTPRKASGQVTVATRATSGSGLAPASAQISGSVTPNAVPVINPEATVHAFNPQVGGPLAPGTIIAVYGSNLATQVAQPSSIPLATSLNGTSVIIGGIPAPLFFVSPGQINVQVPFELDPAKQYQVVVSANGAIATPQSIQLTPAVPGLAAFGDGTLIAQHQDGSLVSQTSPAQQGEYLVMYLLGMGLTDNPVVSGNSSPSDPLARPTAKPTLTLGGTPIPIAFAGLTPGLVGLYQINMQMPQDAPGGNQLLVVSQDGVVSNTTILPVQLQ